jgi:hypothetical protein
MSNKSFRRMAIFVCWLDHPSDIQIRAFDTLKERWSDSVLLGQGTDNHGGPALTMDSRGTLYGSMVPITVLFRSAVRASHSQLQNGKNCPTLAKLPPTPVSSVIPWIGCI